MARVQTLRKRVQEIIRRYKHVNAQKFCYNKKSELNRKFKRIRVWYLIHDKARGYSVLKMEYKRIMPMNVETWARLHRKPVGNYQPLYNIFTQAILPAINNKGGNSWAFISLLAWAGVHAIRSSADTAASRGRHKKAEKGNADERRMRRG